MSNVPPIIAIDIGNSRIKFGRFDLAPQCAAGLPAGGLPIAPPRVVEPSEVLTLTPVGDGAGGFDFAQLEAWLAEQAPAGAAMVVGSVSRPSALALREFLAPREAAAGWSVVQLTGESIPISNRTEFPERVGVDRLAAALAAGRLRRDGAPAIVVDLGTAITVDLVTPEGAFAGGAILPGLRMAAAALHERTDALPLVAVDLEGKSPAAVGTSTEGAMAAGLYWGTAGAVREVVARQRDSLTQAPQVFVTGSASPEFARLVGSPDYTVRYVPHLVLSGLAIAAMERGQGSPS